MRVFLAGTGSKPWIKENFYDFYRLSSYEYLKKDSKEILPFCSNFLNVDKGTPDLSAKPSCVSSICNLLSRTFSTNFFCAFDDEINNIIVVFNCILSK